MTLKTSPRARADLDIPVHSIKNPKDRTHQNLERGMPQKFTQPSGFETTMGVVILDDPVERSGLEPGGPA